MFQIGERRDQRSRKDPRGGSADDGVAVAGDGVVGGERRRKRRAALREYLEEHAEGPPRPVELALDHCHGEEPVVVRCGRAEPAEVGEPALDVPVDGGEAAIGGGKVFGERGIGSVLRAKADILRGQGNQAAGPAGERPRLDLEELGGRLARRRN